MSEKLEIQIVDGGGPGPAPSGGTGPAASSGPGPAGGNAQKLAQQAMQAAGKSGGTAAEAEAGAMSKVPALGPLAFAVQLVEAEMKALTGAAHEAGRALTVLGSLSPDAAVDEMSHLAKQIPLVGQFYGAVIDGLHSFANALDGTARKLAPFNAELSAAVAQSNIRQLQGDIRRAEMLGPDLAKFMDAKSKASQNLQDQMARLLVMTLPRMTNIMDTLDERITFMSLLVEAIGSKGLWDAATSIEEIAAEAKRKKEADAKDRNGLIEQVYDAMTHTRPDRGRPIPGRPLPANNDPVGRNFGPEARPFGV